MFLNSQCFFGELTDDLLSTCQPFSCGNETVLALILVDYIKQQ